MVILMSSHHISSQFGNFFCPTLNTLSVGGRLKKIIKTKKHGIYEKCVMEGISMCGNCGVEEL